MQTFAEHPGTARPAGSDRTPAPRRAHSVPDPAGALALALRPQRQGTPRAGAGTPAAGPPGREAPGRGSGFGRIPLRPRTGGALQARYEVGAPGDRYEQEADRVAEQVVRMDAPGGVSAAPPSIQRLCAGCEEEMLHREAAAPDAGIAAPGAEAKIDAVRGGEPLTAEQRAYFEPRFGADFSRVRIHTDRSADAAARAIGAHAYTRGRDIVFRGDRYRPHTHAGRRLLAHELTHAVQQGTAPRVQRQAAGEAGAARAAVGDLHTGAAGSLVQRFPGDGMTPPGDCGWARYLVLRGAVETAKAVVSPLGACGPGDNCVTLATKIAAISAEIAARVALDTTCFKGGDAGHRQQVQDKVNMMNRCFRFFTDSGCPPELVAAMAVVVETARAAIAATALAVALALVVALIAAIIALAKVIAALVAAAAAATAEAAAIAAAVTAVIALLVLIKDEIAPDDSEA